MEPDSKDPKPLSPVKRALIELRRSRARVEELERWRSEPIAVVGVGLRFPGGACDAESLWELLRSGTDAITEVPPDRWNIEDFYDPDPDAPGKMSTRWGGFLQDIEDFDADFFGISWREALTMDPQQRLLMTVAWEALENAGQSPHGLRGTATGVFIGIASFDHLQVQIQRSAPEEIDAYLATGNCHSVASGRLSYFLGLEGPSISVDTACSSSLVAIHLACQSLRARECDAALAGGVNAILSPELVINFSKARMMAADGRCKVFDAAADGYVRGEGAGMVVLKRLSDALKDRDRILVLIRGSAVNQDGRSNGLTAPNGRAQRAVIRQALRNARVEPSDLSYVETHGTGTALGDPIEVQALAGALGAEGRRDRPLLLGSIKTNIGHLESAAGVASLIKVILSLQHEEIPPNLHFKNPNPYIPWNDLAVRVPTAITPWPANGRRVAGVSSFGFSGTNAHVVLEEAPRPVMGQQMSAESGDHLLCLSARSHSGLRRLSDRYENYLVTHAAASLKDICYTASAGRAHFDHRIALIASNHEDMRQKLAALTPADKLSTFSEIRHESGHDSEVVFFFPGRAECVSTGTKLFQSEPAFCASLDECDAARGDLQESVISLLYEKAHPSPVPGERRHAQVALFAFEYALARVWRSWGVKPALMAGAGVGEVVAAVVAGAISLEDGLKIAEARSRLLDDLAQENSSDSLDGYALDEFQRICARVRFQSPEIALFSSLHLKTISDASTLDGSYWGAELSKKAGAEAAAKALYARGYRIFIEIGPASGFAGLGDCLPRDTTVCLSSLRCGHEERRTILESLGALYRHGVEIDWDAFYRGHTVQKFALPTYPFEPRRFRLAADDKATKSGAENGEQDVWSGSVAAARQQSRQAPLDLALQSYHAKWRVLDRLATAYMAKTLQGLGAYAGKTPFSLEALLERCGILPSYKILIARWLKKLSAEGWLREIEGEYGDPKPSIEIQAAALLDEANKELSDAPFIVEYLACCGALAGDVLTGKVSALETLFPQGSTDFAEKLYEQWAYSRYFNAIVRSAVEGVAAGWPRGRQLRCLEIGAGTGGTTASILPALPAEHTLFYFTDVSDFFSSRAAQKFSDYPFVRYHLLDIEQDPEPQGYGRHSFDLVIAANALHATWDIGATLERTLSLLAPEGLLLLYEVTAPPAWFDISIALIEGWQLFKDGIRLDSPLMSREQWNQSLRLAGFSDVEAYPEMGSPAEVLGAHVFLARAPGASNGRQAELSPTLQESPAGAPPAQGAQDPRGAMAATSSSCILSKLRAAAETERRELLIEFVQHHVAQVLRREGPDLIPRHHRLMEIGVDSLMAVELRSRLGNGLDLAQTLPATLIFSYPTIEFIAAYLEKQLFPDVAPAQGQASPQNIASRGLGDLLSEVSEDQMADLLLKKLESM